MVLFTDYKTIYLTPDPDPVSYNITPENVHNFNSNSIASNILENSHSNSVLSNTSNLNLEVNVSQNQKCNASSIQIIHHKKDQVISFNDFLRSWAVQENINASSLNNLLRGFSNYGLNVTYGLPLNSRTLLNTPRSTDIRQVKPGFYSNLGIEQGLLEYLKINSNVPNNSIEILFNVDGLPVTKSGSSFCADSPAKAMVLNIKYHTGYSSCTKCNIVGDYSERRVCFTDYIGQKRSDKSFTDHEDEDYHQGTSPLENIPRHCKKIRIRIPFRNVQLISSALIHLVKNHVPIEFQRKPRSLNYVRKWKATEYRQLLLHTGPFILKNILNDKVYENFITLHVAVSILCSNRYCYQQKWLNYAKNLIECFVKQFGIIYGKHNISYNIHGLLHLVDDVENYGSLDNFSTFQFESYLGHLKKKNTQRRQTFATNSSKLSNSSDINTSKQIIFNNPHMNGPLLQGCTNSQYKKLIFNDMTFIVNDNKSDCCCVKENKIITIFNIALKDIDGLFAIIGKEYLKKSDLYKLPCPSSTLGIYEVDDLSEFMTWPVKDIEFKYFSFPICLDSTRMACIIKRLKVDSRVQCIPNIWLFQNKNDERYSCKLPRPGTDVHTENQYNKAVKTMSNPTDFWPVWSIKKILGSSDATTSSNVVYPEIPSPTIFQEPLFELNKRKIKTRETSSTSSTSKRATCRTLFTDKSPSPVKRKTSINKNGKTIGLVKRSNHTVHSTKE
ncbi:Uncharacterized protein FWK35_00027213 [Aphis craccivora]|uniref:DUF4806 domain-containing protein n=1 Tax=Aphis craccivora TaxID=307492 RepID=A0A6G0WSR9_APHCR|nr:Uncharacterized protein FWK35_00027213 [Aphis craccivora]